MSRFSDGRPSLCYKISSKITARITLEESPLSRAICRDIISHFSD
jgi:hypothetical protein